MQPLAPDASGDPLPDRRHGPRATFRTQAGALFRKNAAYQRRNRRTNCCITVTPIIFIMLLFVIQQVVNNALDTPDNRCGCECLRCCDKNPSGPDTCRDATPEAPCYPGTYTGDCKTFDKNNCGVQFSTQDNAAFCELPSPSVWPALLQVPREQYRAEPYRPATAVLFTGGNATTARGIAGGLFHAANLTNGTAVADAAATVQAGLKQTLPDVNAAPLSSLGFVLGTPADQYNTVFLEAAFVQNLPLYNMNPSCAAAAARNSTAALQTILGTAASNGINFGADVQCTGEESAFVADVPAIERQLYCGFYQAKCNTSAPYATNAYVGAYDFGNTSDSAFSLTYYFNDTNALNSTQGPPKFQRMNQGLNMAVNAFLAWALGPGVRVPLLGVTEMPKPGTKLQLDFASLLGPIFFTWLSQLLLPILLVALVYEKQNGLRIMMKMHGLGDGAYFAVQYVWFLVLYCAYMLVLLAIGSAVDIKFFRANGYGLQIVFYFIWGNCLVAFGFVLSTLFKSVKTAVVVGYLYTIGSGLLGYLLFQSLIERQWGWVWVFELMPAFALYRGLYEFSQYAFLSTYGSGHGLSFSNVGDGYNGIGTAMAIMVVEWAVFLVLAIYLEQVLRTGTGVRRHPLFFLEGLKRKQRRRSASVSNADIELQPATGKGASIEAAGKHVAVGVESEDVAEERARVNSLPANGAAADAILVRDLRKVYPAQDGNPAKAAVKGLALGIQRGEVFGLLGPNGAGKTSAINMLVGFLEPTSGTALIEGLDIRHDMAQIYALMGVCPQHDLLWEQLTPVEHLSFYGRLKSLKGEPLRGAIESGLRAVNLWGVRNKKVGEFSGGMKRRLSVAISFVGDPAVVYLDEPSTGLDPASRRNLWEVVKKSREGRGIVLTTHSMEEAEVLCDRLGIFVDGQLVCVGAPKEITARYGGYLVFTVTTPTDPASLEAADRLVRRMAPGARRTYALAGTQKYELPTAEVSLSQVFTAMEAAKGSLQVLDWGVANATLEEVFIKFARSIGAEGEK